MKFKQQEIDIIIQRWGMHELGFESKNLKVDINAHIGLIQGFHKLRVSRCLN